MVETYHCEFPKVIPINTEQFGGWNPNGVIIVFSENDSHKSSWFFMISGAHDWKLPRDRAAGRLRALVAALEFYDLWKHRKSWTKAEIRDPKQSRSSRGTSVKNGSKRSHQENGDLTRFNMWFHSPNLDLRWFKLFVVPSPWRIADSWGLTLLEHMIYGDKCDRPTKMEVIPRYIGG